MIVSVETNVNLLGLDLILSMCILLLLVPRKYAPIPVLILTCFVTLGQRIIVAGADFTMVRILVLFGWTRLTLRGEIHRLKLTAIDKALICWVIASVVTYNILWQTSGAFINSMGKAYNVVGIYFLFRYLINDFDDIIRIIKWLAIIVVTLALAASVESATGRNVFAYFGGVAEFTPLRDGKVRSTFSFGDAILAGTFGTTLMPLIFGLWFQKISRKLVLCGVVASTIITIMARSSGPVVAYCIEIIAFMMWPFRKKMRAVRWGFLACALALHMFMKAPVWALIGRLSEVFGGHGYDRVELIDAAISHFGEWWLFGATYTAHWGPTVLVSTPNMVDMTNQFVYEGVEGGLLRLFLFIAMIAYSFRAIGRTIRAVEGQSVATQIYLWSMGVALIGHVTSFISVSYFSQIEVLFDMLLAMISACEGIFPNTAGILLNKTLSWPGTFASRNDLS